MLTLVGKFSVNCLVLKKTFRTLTTAVIELSPDFAFESRLRFNVAIQVEDKLSGLLSAERKVVFIVKLVKKLNQWIAENELEQVDYESELLKMPVESTGAWFAEKWNLWLKDELEKAHDEKSLEKEESEDLKAWIERHAPWKCDGLIDFNHASVADRYHTFLRKLRNAQLIKEDSFLQEDDDGLPPALLI